MATYLEVKQQIEALQKQAETLKATERQGVIDRMREAIEVYDITAAELGIAAGAETRAAKGASAKKTARKQSQGTATAKYSDGKGNSWVGRGPRPAWLKAALAAGASLTGFAVGRSKS